MIVALGLLIAFILVLIFSRPATRNCRWRRSGQGADTLWTCHYCGARVPGDPDRSPRLCHRGDTGAG